MVKDSLRKTSKQRKYLSDSTRKPE